MQDRVTLIAGWSRQIELPEPADLLVSEIIGNEPFEEEILETTLDARRLLKPGARLIPNALTLLARPLLIPEEEARQRAIGHEAIKWWECLYDIDFQPLLDAASADPVNAPTEGEVVARWPPVGPPVVLTSLDFGTLEMASVDAAVDLVVDEARAINAVAVTFRAALHRTIAHTLDPWRWPASSWATSLWTLADTLQLGPREALRMHYRRRVDGAPDGLTCEIVERGRRLNGGVPLSGNGMSPRPSHDVSAVASASSARHS